MYFRTIKRKQPAPFGKQVSIGGSHPTKPNIVTNNLTDWCFMFTSYPGHISRISLYGHILDTCREFTKRHPGYMVNLFPCF